VQQIIGKSDFDGNQCINYTEFLSATVDLNKYLSEQKLLAVFRQFDTDNSGQLTPQNIKYAMQKLGYEVDLADIKTIVT
jgi:Ca2+-binding EF-hand superfamily protein